MGQAQVFLARGLAYPKESPDDGGDDFFGPLLIVTRERAQRLGHEFLCLARIHSFGLIKGICPLRSTLIADNRGWTMRGCYPESTLGFHR